jgi:hypothetical protein
MRVSQIAREFSGSIPGESRYGESYEFNQRNPASLAGKEAP